MSSELRILTFSTLYPSSVMPGNGVFVETRLRQLLKRAPHYEARVVAPVPWFPLTGVRFGRYARLGAIPKRETLHGIPVEHPRYVVVPKVSWQATPAMMAVQCYPTLRRLLANGFDFDVIDAHYLFPDAVAAALLARATGKPFVMTARGSDVRELARYALPRAQIRWAARRASRVIAVSAALARDLAVLGVASERLEVLRNGVDLSFFAPGDRNAARERLGLSTGLVIASVGRLVVLKGHDLAIHALPLLPDATLLIVGEGPERGRLASLAKASGVATRVRFLGEIAQDRLVTVYRSADALILASRHEGWPNVLLEAMSCGCPVVASPFDGIREVVQRADAGVIMSERSPAGIAEGVRQLLAAYPGMHATRRYAENFGWNATSDTQIEVFDSIARMRRDSPHRERVRAAS